MVNAVLLGGGPVVRLIGGLKEGGGGWWAKTPKTTPYTVGNQEDLPSNKGNKPATKRA